MSYGLKFREMILKRESEPSEKKIIEEGVLTDGSKKIGAVVVITSL